MSDYDANLYNGMAVDDYDPTSPENLIPVTKDEEEREKAETLKQQMAKLEAMLDRRQPEPRVSQHYERVLAEMRYTAGPQRRSHARMRSDPAGQGLPDETHQRPFTHARVRSAPVDPTSSCMDETVPGERTPHARPPAFMMSKGPGEQLSLTTSPKDMFRSGRPCPLPSPPPHRVTYQTTALSPGFSANTQGIPRWPRTSPVAMPGKMAGRTPKNQAQANSLLNPMGMCLTRDDEEKFEIIIPTPGGHHSNMDARFLTVEAM